MKLFGSSPDHRAARSQVGFAPEEPDFPKYLRADEVLDYFGQLLGLTAAERRQRISEASSRARSPASDEKSGISPKVQLSAGDLRLDGGQNPLDRVPGASAAVDIWFWFAYVVAICAVLFWSVRRKQV